MINRWGLWTGRLKIRKQTLKRSSRTWNPSNISAGPPGVNQNTSAAGWALTTTGISTLSPAVTRRLVGFTTNTGAREGVTVDFFVLELGILTMTRSYNTAQIKICKIAFRNLFHQSYFSSQAIKNFKSDLTYQSHKGQEYRVKSLYHCQDKNLPRS